MIAGSGQSLMETPDPDGAFPRLTDEQIDTLARLGSVRPTRVGDRLYEQGAQAGDFYVVLAGMVAVVEGAGARQRIVQVHGPRRFLGEVGLLEGQPAFVGAVVVQPGEVLAVPLDSLRPVVLGDPALGEEILRAYLIRRSLLIGHGAGLRIIGSCFSPDTRRLLEFAARNRLPHRYLDVEKDAKAETLLTRFGVPPDETPVVVLDGKDLLRNPSNAELASRMGLRRPEPRPEVSDLLVIGAGPAGLATVVYAASDGLTVAAVEGTATGGQAGTTSRIENYLGFPAGISGAELAERSTIQADKFGGRVTVPAAALTLRPCGGHHLVGLDDGTELTARAVVIATGVRYRRLPVPGIERYEGTCVYYAATAHEARTCRTAPVSVVGGGNSAGQAAVFLARESSQVHLLVRGGDLGDNMSRYLVDQVTSHPRIAVLTHTEVRDVVGDEDLRGLVVEDTAAGERQVVDTQVLFVFIGARPHTTWLAGAVALDPDGFVLTGPDADGHRDDGVWRHVPRRPLALETTRPGVFAVGDVRRGSVKRVSAAAGEGATAVRMVHDHLFEED